jgi:hypothetical protein
MASDKTPQVKTPEDWKECREAFVGMVTLENFLAERHSRLSLKATRAGKQEGFHDRRTQNRWLDFRKGWNACMLREHFGMVQKHTLEWIKKFPKVNPRSPAVITGCIKK